MGGHSDPLGHIADRVSSLKNLTDRFFFEFV